MPPQATPWTRPCCACIRKRKRGWGERESRRQKWAKKGERDILIKDGSTGIMFWYDYIRKHRTHLQFEEDDSHDVPKTRVIVCLGQHKHTYTRTHISTYTHTDVRCGCIYFMMKRGVCTHMCWQYVQVLHYSKYLHGNESCDGEHPPPPPPASLHPTAPPTKHFPSLAPWGAGGET